MPVVFTGTISNGGDDVSDSKIAEWSRPQSEDEIRDLLERARRGDQTELAALRQAMNQHPELWEAYGDLASHAQAPGLT